MIIWKKGDYVLSSSNAVEKDGFCTAASSELSFKGQNVGLPVMTYPFEDGYYVGDQYVAEDQSYLIFGAHGCNPMSYRYLDQVVILDKGSIETKAVNLHFFNKEHNNPVSKLQKVEISNGKYYAYTGNKKLAISVKEIMLKNLENPSLPIEMQTSAYKGEYNLANYLTATVMPGYDVLFKLKEGVSRTELLQFNGFDMKYDMFKLENLTNGKDNALVFLDSREPSNTWTVTWGTRTTLTDDLVWSRRDQLLQVLADIVPSHPYCQQNYFRYFMREVMQ